MWTPQASTWQPSTNTSTEAACEHCQGMVYHERWCVTRSELVLYAFEAVRDADALTEADKLILHAWGVKWTNNLDVAA